METKDLFSCLKEQHQVLRQYLVTLLAHQKAIINGDLAGIEDTLKNETSLLFNIGDCEARRQDIIQQLAAKYSFEVNSNKLSEFIDKVKSKKLFDTSNLVKIRDSLQMLISEIIKVNTQNKFLIEQARNFIKELVAAFTQSNENAIVDRRY